MLIRVWWIVIDRHRLGYRRRGWWTNRFIGVIIVLVVISSSSASPPLILLPPVTYSSCSTITTPLASSCTLSLFIVVSLMLIITVCAFTITSCACLLPTRISSSHLSCCFYRPFWSSIRIVMFSTFRRSNHAFAVELGFNLWYLWSWSNLNEC